MPSRNILQSVNLSVSSERRGVSGGCPNPALNPSASCGTNLLDYTVLSFDEAAQKWYPANQFGFYTSSVNTAGTITGSASLININQSGCIYPAIQWSGSASFPISATGVNLGIVTGSFTLAGTFVVGPDTYAWSLSSIYENSGSSNLAFSTNGGGGATNYTYNAQTTKNSLVGFQLDSYTGPFTERAVTYAVSGSLISYNPPVTSYGFPLQLGTTVTLSGVGVIRVFGFESGSVAQQTQYNCLYGSTPTK